MAPILQRKLDLVYLIFFIIHVPVMFFVDLVAVYPDWIKLDVMHTIRTFYIDTYHDRFFTQPPAWFALFIWMEALYHVPLSFWAIGALLRDDPKIPVHLLIYAIQTVITTSTCIADFLSWEGFSSAEKLELCKLYVPYLAVSVFMGTDMYSRLDVALSRRVTGAQKKMS